MTKRKSRKARTVPCGTPKFTLGNADEIPSYLVWEEVFKPVIR